MAKGRMKWFKGEGLKSLGEGDEVELGISQPKRPPRQQCKTSLLKKRSFALASVHSREL